MRPKGEKPEGEAEVNDSPVDCQSRRTDRSIFSAEKIQERRFKSCPRNQKKTIAKAIVFFNEIRSMRNEWNITS